MAKSLSFKQALWRALRWKLTAFAFILVSAVPWLSTHPTLPSEHVKDPTVICNRLPHYAGQPWNCPSY